MDLSLFNPPQREAILHGEGPMLVLAGAGSGKTRVIVHRIAYLIQERGVHAHNILAVTFTNKAAGEMKERLHSLLGCEPPHVSTFHSFCARTLRTEIPLAGYSKNFTIADDTDCEKIIKEAVKELHLDPEQYKPAKVAEFIDSAKNVNLYPHEINVYDGDHVRQNLVKIYDKYQSQLKRTNTVDFGDLLMLMVRIFDENPKVLGRYQDRFRWILADEYQDTNIVQYKLVKQLAGRFRNLCVVGDDDQSIYGWRGADIQNILGMEQDFPDLKTIRLEQNYRCTKTILHAANTVIANNRMRKGKTLWTGNSDGEAIISACLLSERGEGYYVADTIKAGLRAGRPCSDYAVLYRMNSLSRSIEEALMRAGIPYVIVGGFRFFDRAEIKDALAYLRVIANPADDMAIKRIINVPARGIGATSVDTLTKWAAKNKVSMLDAARVSDRTDLKPAAQKKVKEFANIMDALLALAEKTPSPTELLSALLDRSGYIKALEDDGSEEAEGRAENLKELVSVMVDFEKSAQEPTIEAFIEHAALMTATDTSAGQSDCVTLMTMHASKGLEFPEVFIIGMEQGIFPTSRALENEADMEEERRLCYVGITRAKKRLHLTYTTSRRLYGKETNPVPSAFFGELPPHCLREI